MTQQAGAQGSTAEDASAEGSSVEVSTEEPGGGDEDGFLAKRYAWLFPVAGGGCLLIGAAAGVPLGMSIGRAEEAAGGAQTGGSRAASVSSTDGARMAGRALGIATAINVALACVGTAAFVGYTGVRNVDEAVHVMRTWTVGWRSSLEMRTGGAVNAFRHAGTVVSSTVGSGFDGLGSSKFGAWFNSNLRERSERRVQANVDREIRAQQEDEEVRRREKERRERGWRPRPNQDA